jgi:hypothetical protein
MKRYWTKLVVAVSSVGCSQVLGLKDPSLEGGEPDAPKPDAPKPDAAVDAPLSSNVWIYTTNAQFNGGFGAANARAVADAKCEDMYRFAYANRACSNVRAVLQVDSNLDTLARMGGTYSIPAAAPVLRASDATPVAAKWDDVVDPSLPLQAEVTPSGSSLYFWSGRGVVMDRQCINWSSNANASFGDIGDATKRNGWVSVASLRCDDLSPHLLCVCW